MPRSKPKVNKVHIGHKKDVIKKHNRPKRKHEIKEIKQKAEPIKTIKHRRKEEE